MGVLMDSVKGKSERVKALEGSIQCMLDDFARVEDCAVMVRCEAGVLSLGLVVDVASILSQSDSIVPSEQTDLLPQCELEVFSSGWTKFLEIPSIIQHQ